MAALNGIKRRIRSVGNIRQITKAMQLVAASELRRAQAAAVAPQAYTTAALELLSRLGSHVEALRHPLYQVRPINRALTIVIAGERGMAGAYNGNILKSLIRHTAELGVPHSAICVGRYAASHVAKFSDMDELAAYDIEAKNPDVEIAQPILTEASALYTAGEVDSVHIIYTHFVSTMKQVTVTEQLLPVHPVASDYVDNTLEPNAEALLDFATKRLLEAQILQAVLESRASEQAARMMAMMSASDNAGELIEDLTLAYNNERQAVITQELAEISAGAEAVTA